MGRIGLLRLDLQERHGWLRSESQKPARHHVAFVALLTLGSAAIRSVIAFRGGLWRDEALFLGIVNLPTWNETVGFLRLHESHPPLYYAMVRGWLTVTGWTDRNALLLSIIFGVLLVPTVYLVGRLWFGSTTGLISAALIAILPSVNADGSTARPYAFLTLVVLISTYLLVSALESGRLATWLGHGVSTGVLVLTHNWAWLVVMGMSVAAVNHARSALRPSRVLAGLAMSLTTCIAISLPWLSTLLFQTRVAGHAGVSISGIADVGLLLTYAAYVTVSSTLLPSLGGDRWMAISAVALAAGVLILGRLATTGSVGDENARLNRQAIRAILTIAGVSIFVATMLSPSTNLLVGRCLATLSPLLLLGVVARATHWMRSSGDPQRRATVLAVGIVLVGVYASVIVDLTRKPRSNARELAATVEQRQHAGDLVVVSPGWLGSSFNHYTRTPTSQVVYTGIPQSPLFDFTNLARRLSDSTLFRAVYDQILNAADGNRRVWLISDSFSFKPVNDDDRLKASKGAPGSLGKVRTEEIRRLLYGRFGKPVWSAPMPEAAPTLELLTAELFAASANSPPVRAPLE